LRHLHADAGFQDNDIQVVSLTIRHDDAAQFISGLMASFAFAEATAALDKAKQKAAFDDLMKGPGPYLNCRRLAMPHVAHVASAHS
jgi:hypothetical protein